MASGFWLSSGCLGGPQGHAGDSGKGLVPNAYGSESPQEDNDWIQTPGSLSTSGSQIR